MVQFHCALLMRPPPCAKINTKKDATGVSCAYYSVKRLEFDATLAFDLVILVLEHIQLAAAKVLAARPHTDGLAAP